MLPLSRGDGCNQQHASIELVALFGQVLGIAAEQVGHNDNFFSLGGNSMAASRLLGLIRERFTVRISFVDFFTRPTVGFIMERLQSVPAASDVHARIEPQATAVGAWLPLSSAQSRIYYVDRLQPNAATYNVVGVYEISGGAVALDRLAHAFRTVIRRHDILRTSYAEVSRRSAAVRAR